MVFDDAFFRIFLVSNAITDTYSGVVLCGFLILVKMSLLPLISSVFIHIMLIMLL